MASDSGFKFVTVEKLNPNDASYKVVSINREEGDFVCEGDVVMTIETSKVAADVVAPCDGHLHCLKVSIGDSVFPNQNIAVVVSGADSFDCDLAFSSPTNESNQSKVADATPEKFSRKALEFIRDNNIDLAAFDSYTSVTLDDVIDYANTTISKFQLLTPSPLPSSNDIYLLGGLGTARMLIDLIRAIGTYRIKGIIDPSLPTGHSIDSINVIGGDDVLDEIVSYGPTNLALAYTALSDLEGRLEKFRLLKSKGFRFPVLIHPSASIEPSATLGEGCIALAGAIIGSHANLEALNFINTGAIVSHEVVAGENNHFAPNSTVAGKVTIGSCNLFGMNSTIFMGLEIGSNNIINNNTSVLRSLGSGLLVESPLPLKISSISRPDQL